LLVKRSMGRAGAVVFAASTGDGSGGRVGACPVMRWGERTCADARRAEACVGVLRWPHSANRGSQGRPGAWTGCCEGAGVRRGGWKGTAASTPTRTDAGMTRGVYCGVSNGCPECGGVVSDKSASRPCTARTTRAEALAVRSPLLHLVRGITTNRASESRRTSTQEQR
jgi:hypothetical protein